MKTTTQRQCPQGHTYFKSSDCPVCPVCEKQRESPLDFATQLGAPARRALEGLGINKLEDLTRFTPQEILGTHGFGPSGFKIIEKLMREKGLSFR